VILSCGTTLPPCCLKVVSEGAASPAAALPKHRAALDAYVDGHQLVNEQLVIAICQGST
jgi:hypothetical protein